MTDPFDTMSLAEVAAMTRHPVYTDEPIETGPDTESVLIPSR
ncbi:hypothetical protein [Nocardia sp. NPDC004711]